MAPAALNGAAPGRSRGFALIVVLWFLVLLAAIGIYMMANARSETALARNLLAAARAEAVAEGAIAQAAFNQSDPDPRNRWKLDGTPYHLKLPGGEATVRLFDEHLKINPNLASETLLAALFQVLGVDKGKAASLGAAVADWVSPGDKPRPQGAKKEQYQQAGKSYGPPNAALESLDELQLVLGMTPQILNAALPYLTIFTDAPAPEDPKKVTGPVLAAIQTAGQNNLARNDAGPTPTGGAATPAPQAPQPPDNDSQPVAGQPAGAAPAPAAAAAPAANDDPVIAIDATARSADGGVFVRDAVIKLEPDKPKGYTVLDWRRRDLAE